MQRTAGAAAILAFGLALVWLAAPRTVAHATMAVDDHVMDSLARGDRVPRRQVLIAIAGRRQALRWLDLADGWNDIGALYLFLARRPGLDETERAALLDRSIRSFGRGLALAPARPFAWLQLAQARFAREPASPAAVGAPLRLSYRTAPLEPRLVSQRVRLGFAARGVLTRGLADRVTADVRLWAAHDPWRLASWARPQFALPWVRDALAGHAALDREFLSSYLRLPPR